MKTAYIYLSISENISIDQTFDDKARALHAIGSSAIDVIILNPFKEKNLNSIRYVKMKTFRFPFCYIDYLFQRYKLIEKSINLKKYSNIILRYPGSDYSGIYFTNKYSVITEHHTDEISERNKNLKQKNPFPVKIIQIIRWFQEKLFSKHILSKCHGIIAVTDEIKKIELSKIKKSIPAVTISNGIFVDNITFTKYGKFNKKDIRLVIIAIHFAPWHGFQRLLKSLEKYNGPIQFEFHIIGNILPSQINNNLKSNKIIFHGIKSGHELDQVLKNMHIGISTIALFSKNMKEACSLKTREYTARGLPFILAYNDSDLDSVNNEMNFFLEFDNNDTLIDMEKIIHFVTHLNEQKNRHKISQYMRQYALTHMDWKIKMQLYIDFLNKYFFG